MPGISFIQGCVSAPGLIVIFLSVPGLISFFVSQRFMSSVSSCEIKPCPFSDQDFVYLCIESSGSNSRGPGVWKFNNSLLNDSGFCKYIKTCIVDLSGCLQHFPSVKSWWDFFKYSIRSQIIYFSKNKCKELSHERVLLVNRIIDLNIKLTFAVSSEISELESELNTLTLKEFRSRVQWLEERERPTRYFFKLERKRFERNILTSILDSNDSRFLHVKKSSVRTCGFI